MRRAALQMAASGVSLSQRIADASEKEMPRSPLIHSRLRSRAGARSHNKITGRHAALLDDARRYDLYGAAAGLVGAQAGVDAGYLPGRDLSPHLLTQLPL